MSTDINGDELLDELLDELIQKQKEYFVRYNLIFKERLFNDCGNQFNREASKDIVNEGNGIGVTQWNEYK